MSVDRWTLTWSWHQQYFPWRRGSAVKSALTRKILQEADPHGGPAQCGKRRAGKDVAGACAGVTDDVDTCRVHGRTTTEVCVHPARRAGHWRYPAGGKRVTVMKLAAEHQADCRGEPWGPWGMLMSSVRRVVLNSASGDAAQPTEQCRGYCEGHGEPALALQCKDRTRTLRIF